MRQRARVLFGVAVLMGTMGFVGCDFFETWDTGDETLDAVEEIVDAGDETVDAVEEIVDAGAETVNAGEPVEEVLPSGGYTTGTGPGGMDFHLAVIPLDGNGQLITGGVTAESFSFHDVNVFRQGDPSGVPVTHSSETVVTGIETIPGADDLNVVGVLAMDSSGSMSDSDPKRLRVEAAREFIGLLRENDELAIIHFGTGPNYEMLHDFSSDRAALSLAADGVVADGGTPLNDALVYSLDLLEDRLRFGSEKGVYPLVVVLTDGQENSSSASLNEVIERAVLLGVPVFSVGLGTDVDSSYLTKLAVDTQGEFVMAEYAHELAERFEGQMVANSQGRVVVHGHGRFATQLSSGAYMVRGGLDAEINGGSASTNFSLLLSIP